MKKNWIEKIAKLLSHSILSCVILDMIFDTENLLRNLFKMNRFLRDEISTEFRFLRLQYVPGDHGSHGSPKRSAPCDLVNFCLGTQVLLNIITFRHGLSRYPLQTVG